MLDLLCLVFLALERSQTNNNIVGFLPWYFVVKDLQRGPVKKVVDIDRPKGFSSRLPECYVGDCLEVYIYHGIVVVVIFMDESWHYLESKKN